jgi:XRE family aerobic/anaerobic benzoate catabolism transcriptional regulator
LPEPIVLVGLRGVGKTTVGRLLARELGWGFDDLDDVTARLACGDGLVPAGTTAGEMLERLGLEQFRACEAKALGWSLIHPRKIVLAAGGGLIEQQAARDHLRERAFCIWLRAAPELLAARVEADPTPRPSLVPGGALAEARELSARRAPWYREVCKLEFDCGTMRPEEVTSELLRRLEPLRGEP